MEDYFNNFCSNFLVINTYGRFVLAKVGKDRFVCGNSSSNDMETLVNL